MESASEIFYSIYGTGRQSDIVSDIIRQLDFHALSITLLATVASRNGWDHEELAKEWNVQRTQALQAGHNKSLAATIELSLGSPTFRKLGPTARELLEIVAFFPQGLDKNSLGWLFPSTVNGRAIFDKFHTLSLTYRNNGFITMLAPIRDYLYPQDSKTSSFLGSIKDRYFDRLSVDIDPNDPGFGETRWIVSEDTNIEHLLDVFTTIDPTANDTWNVCAHFLEHLYWHKPRRTALGKKIQELPNIHPAKPDGLFWLSQLFGVTGGFGERKRLLTIAVRLERERGNHNRVARALRALSDANRMLELYEEGIQQAKEALEINERLGDMVGQAQCLYTLGCLLVDTQQLDAAEEALSRAINILPETGQENLVCKSHRFLGQAYRSKRTYEKAHHHYGISLEVASRFNWPDQLLWIHWSLAWLFYDQEKFDDAQVHIERAKSHAGDDPYSQGRMMQVQADIWYRQGRFKEARAEALHALEIYEKVGAPEWSREECRDVFEAIERAIEGCNQ